MLLQNYQVTILINFATAVQHKPKKENKFSREKKEKEIKKKTNQTLVRACKSCTMQKYITPRFSHFFSLSLSFHLALHYTSKDHTRIRPISAIPTAERRDDPFERQFSITTCIWLQS